MTKNKSHKCDTFGRLAWREYTKPRLKSTRSINAKGCTKITTNLEYIEKISSVRYRLNTGNMMRPKSKNKAKNKAWAKIALY